MYFPDLTPYEYYVKADDKPALNIGWLDAAHDFPKGVPPDGLIARLRFLSQNRVNQMRGFQMCGFCPKLKIFDQPFTWTDGDKALYQACFTDGRFSSAEIRVEGQNGRIYASPVMVAHYIEAHGYLPPQEFIEAVMQIVLPQSN